MGIGIAKKLLIIFIFPVIVLFYYMYENTVEMMELHNEAKKVESVIAFTANLGELIHEAQKERGITMGFLGSGGEKLGEILSKQRIKTDEKRKMLLQTLEELKRDKTHDYLVRWLADSFAGLDKVEDIRKRVDNLDIDRDESIRLYTNINSSFLKVIVKSLRSLKNEEFIKYLNSTINFLYYKEYAGLERAYGIECFMSDCFKGETRLQFYSAIARQQSYEESFYMLASENVIDFYKKTLQGGVIEEIDMIREKVLKAFSSDKLDVDAGYWIDVSTKRIDLLKEVEDHQFEMLYKRSSEVTESAYEKVMWTVILNLSVIVFTIIAGYIVVRRQQNLNRYLAKRIDESVIALNEQNKQMIEQARLASLGEMMNNIAHQWRQPLTALGLVIQKMKLAYESGMLDGKSMSGSVEKSMRLIDGMSKTIDDFRNFFKPDKKKTEFSLKKAVEDSIAMTESILTHHKIKIVTELDEKAVVLGYPNEFSQVLLNIINNARDAMIENRTEEPKIKITVYCENRECVVAVSDNGGGISDVAINKIFEPYFTTKEEGKGTGIGLHMSMMIIKEHMRGSLEVKNVQESLTGEKGAQFIIRLPKVNR